MEGIPEEDLSKIYEFIHWIKIKIVKPKKKEAIERHKEDPLREIIGCCEGPGDLADKHDFYLYGKGKNDLY